jgi:hypothetical protein
MTGLVHNCIKLGDNLFRELFIYICMYVYIYIYVFYEQLTPDYVWKIVTVYSQRYLCFY